MAESPPKAPASYAYAAVEDSQYAVGETSRRERWWFSDGIWLDQGQDGAVVGFGWTHWLADRGVRVPGAELGEAYARDLQREAQLVTGRVGRFYGARIDAAASVLQSRGLIQDCYFFQDIDSVVKVLLERGPIVAGIQWSQEMARPQEIENWIVGRAGPSESPVTYPSICVLLNGIALDLTIGGVTGFVRLKNCWGRYWGDSGHILISLDDLTATMHLEYSLLPIPAASVLRPGVRQDVATDGPPYGPREVRFEQSSIGGDVATRRDTVGAAAYAEAIAAGIQHPETKPPLTIGIKGAWGAGKTSLMRMIRDRLEWPLMDGSSEELRKIRLTTSTVRKLASSTKETSASPDGLSEVTYGAILAKLRARSRADGARRDAADELPLRAELGKAGAATPDDDDRWRPTVWFNPWMYQTGDQVWAGLAYEIIRQVTERMTRGEREHFWLHLNLRRVDEQAVRRRIYALVLNSVLPWAVCGMLALIAGFVILATGSVGWLGTILTSAGAVIAVAGSGVTGWKVLSSKASSALSALTRPTVALGRSVSGQTAGLYQDIVLNPDYRTQSGFLYLVQTDIQRVLDLVATPERPLVIFVDDLDRCSPGTVVQVIEAINIFVAGAYPNSIFVIAMEPEMVAAHIEAAYSDLVQKLDETRNRTSQLPGLGWRFLEKIVQLPLALPAMQPDATMAFYASLFPTDVPPVGSPQPASSAQADISMPEGSLQDASLSDAVSIAGSIQPDAATRRELRRIIERRLTVDDPEVREVIGYARHCLNKNPREIKRFVNLFRFYTMIYAERQLAKLPTPDSLHAVAKLAVLGIRWPSLLSTLALTIADDVDTTVYELLENPPAPEDGGPADAALAAALENAGLNDAVAACLLTPEFRAFMKSSPTVGPGARGYL